MDSQNCAKGALQQQSTERMQSTIPRILLVIVIKKIMQPHEEAIEEGTGNVALDG